MNAPGQHPSALPACPNVVVPVNHLLGMVARCCPATGRSQLEVGSGAEPPRHRRMKDRPRPPTLLQAWPPESSPRRSPLGPWAGLGTTLANRPIVGGHRVLSNTEMPQLSLEKILSSPLFTGSLSPSPPDALALLQRPSCAVAILLPGVWRQNGMQQKRGCEETVACAP